MSRAFVKEPDGEQLGDDLPERPRSSYTNYVTPQGLAQLQRRVRELSAQKEALIGNDDLGARQQLKQVERDLHYYEERVQSAVVVQPEAQSDDKVRFGSTVEVLDSDGQTLRFTIVGEDEADATHEKISWMSPLARALLEAQVGDVVTWKRPVGDKELEVVAIRKG
ncbi:MULTISPECIES: GreA/GreB family elongation factor [Methylocaldum]|jgi:transcription elongation GreA/GreB family factor|uniref:GreA/GreB family elongation factor n=1 Tax=unclassified Methylocaldum TaxID=2622260 RepID=UPI00098B03A7|nr:MULTISPECIES: GreA/GreB family elongation factor [unclassified Methylocaldum]MBP1151505.1 transcription elongation GreA/GreB family factor [Methylocaldum sp. RMAD-M]MDV3240334.1 GreA/GreB family elongation factor [Methylocaldum sp.]